MESRAVIFWLIGIIMAFAGVGVSFMFQGAALERPQDAQRIGKKMRVAGYWWIGAAILFIIVLIILYPPWRIQ